MPAPADVAAVIHVPRPRELQRWLRLFANQGSGIEALATVDPSQFAAGFVGPEIAAVLDFDRALYVTSTDFDLSEIVVSIAAGADVDDLRRQLARSHRFMPIAEGGYALKPLGDAPKAVCELHHAYGAAPVRFVCSSNPKRARAHAAYATRTLPRRLPTGLIRIETLAGGIAKQMSAALAKRQSSPDQRAYDQALVAMFAEFSADLSSSAMELRLVDSGIELALENEIKSAQSALTAAAVMSSPRSASEAATFWRLPADAALAFQLNGSDEKAIGAKGRALVDRLIQSVPEHDLDETAKRETREALHRIVFTGGPITIARGIDLVRARETLNAFGNKRATLEQVHRALSPWTLIFVQDPPERWLSAIRALDAADVRSRARLKARGVTSPSSEEPRYRSSTREVPAGGGLAKGSVHWLTTYTPNPKYAAAKPTDPPAGIRHTGHKFLVPHAGGTWFAFGDDEAVVLAKLRVVTGSVQAGRLDSVAALTPLRRKTNIGFGFITLEATLGTSLEGDSAPEVEAALKSLAELQPQFRARNEPVLLELTGPGREPSATKPALVRLSARVPAAILNAFVEQP